jgi:hypothetical protein
MKTTFSTYKTAQLDDLKIVIREAGDPQTPAMLLLHGLKKLMNTIMTKGGTQICGPSKWLAGIYNSNLICNDTLRVVAAGAVTVEYGWLRIESTSLALSYSTIPSPPHCS